MSLRMPNAGEVALSMRNAEDIFWHSRATLDNKPVPFFRTVNIHKLAKDIRRDFATQAAFARTATAAKAAAVSITGLTASLSVAAISAASHAACVAAPNLAYDQSRPGH